MVEIIIEGPGKNALSSTLMTTLTAKIKEADGRPILLTGAKDAFSAGLDLREVASLDASGMEVFLRRLEALLEALYAYPGPTVAAVNGHAIAGGCLLALCCDWRVVTSEPKARLGLNEVALGLRFPPKVLGILRNRIPPHRVEEVVLGAGLHDPERSLALGLVDETSPDPQLRARERLGKLAEHPADAYAAAKRLLRGTLEASSSEEEAFLAEVIPAWTSPALKERLAALLGGRKS